MSDANFHPEDGISALADDALTGSARAQTAQYILTTAQGAQAWHAYHVIGDVLRSAELAPRGDDHAFWDRLSQKIALEPGRPAHESSSAAQLAVSAQITDVPAPIASANGAIWRWRVLAGAACVALGGGLGVGMWGGASSPAQLAASGMPSPAVTVVDGRNGPMLRDPQLDSLMAAHQQVSGHSALQMPTGFLRNATYDGAAR